MRRPLLSLIAALSVLLALPTSGFAVDIGGTSHHADADVPLWAEPVLPAPTIRLQTAIAPISIGDASVILVPMRLLSSFDFSDKVMGEASIPFVIAAWDNETRIQVGNPRLGLEFPILIKGAMHRWTLSFDFLLPITQIGEPENPDELVSALERILDYAVTTSAFPNLVPDFMPEQLTATIGTHYRAVVQDFTVHAGVDFPLYLNFDFDADTFFDDVNYGLRYGAGFSYDFRPVYPILEFVGYTWLSGDETATTMLAALGARFAFQKFEPGISIAYPFLTADDELETSVYVNVELAYRF